jgi:hypothetical protein
MTCVNHKSRGCARGRPVPVGFHHQADQLRLAGAIDRCVLIHSTGKNNWDETNVLG